MQVPRPWSFLPLLLFIAVALLPVATAHAQALSVLYNFGTKSGDPLQPSFSGIVAQGRDGNLYSTSPSGGTGNGSVFKITPGGVLTVLYNFTGVADGGFPNGGLTLGADGNFYGTTSTGAGCCGTIFKITAKGKLTTLHSFGTSDGGGPLSPPILGSDGSYYGTTVGSVNAPYGTIYKITSAGKFKLLYTFDLTHGAYPEAPLVQGTDGNFYGTTINGGANPGDGAVFKVTPSGVLTVLFNFDNAHGAIPVGPLIQALDGNFYGTTFGGGTSNVGTVFRMTPAGKVTVLHSYDFSPDGGRPNAGLVQGTDGLFYGAAQEGGTVGFGTVYKVDTGGTFNVLYAFDQTTGAYPQVTLMQHTNGSFYSDTINGGSAGHGVFYGLGGNFAAFVSLVPNAAKAGKKVGILGQGFKGTTAVAFNGTVAVFKVTNGTYITATVPSGATTGFATVTTPGGTLVSNKQFVVLP
jgi:uncharacterized repeat protein (TIGR03803 family)